MRFGRLAGGNPDADLARDVAGMSEMIGSTAVCASQSCSVELERSLKQPTHGTELVGAVNLSATARVSRFVGASPLPIAPRACQR
eukprot:6539955-Prymnesium_polylepis.1